MISVTHNRDVTLPNRLLLTHRRNLKTKFLDPENAIRRSLKSFGICPTGQGRTRGL
jgi:hypothetical protein